MKIKFEDFKCCVVSTCHIEEDDNWILHDAVKTNDCSFPLPVYEHDHGYFVNTRLIVEQVDAIRVTGLSVSFVKLILAVKGQGFLWVNLDQDGPDYDELPKFDW